MPQPAPAMLGTTAIGRRARATWRRPLLRLPRRTLAALLLLGVIGGAAAVVWLWWHDTPAGALDGLGARLTAAGRVTGLLGGYLLLVQVALVAEGFADHLVNAGGDVQARGEREPGRPWRVGVSDPLQPDRLLAVVDARDLAVATSGTAERGAHVFDPHRRVAVDELAGVTVVGPSLTWADGYATAALAMGLAAPDWLTGLDGYQALVVDTDGEAWWTPGFPMPGADTRGATATGSRAPE